MTVPLPPGWPDQVPPPATPDWERAAAAWLLDSCPPDYRGYPVLRRQPLALAWLAAKHVTGARRATDDALARCRVELGAHLEPQTVRQVIAVLEAEQARLLALARGVAVLAAALRGERYVPRL